MLCWNQMPCDGEASSLKAKLIFPFLGAMKKFTPFGDVIAILRELRQFDSLSFLLQSLANQRNYLEEINGTEYFQLSTWAEG